MMRKKTGYWVLVIIIFLLIIIFAILPWFFGICFKKHYLALIENLNQDPRYQIEVDQYQQGWFTSNAILHITNQPESSALPINLLIKSHIHHGPFVKDNINYGINLAYARITQYIYT